ncbi:hypothetical protein J7M28_00180, partial [bacterium]|nr:hypothetical protein [bacterium]
MCLSRYEGDRVKINEYVSILQQKLPVKYVADESDGPDDERAGIGPIGPAIRYMDSEPLVNILPLGACSSFANPTVIAATAAKLGVFAPMRVCPRQRRLGLSECPPFSPEI